MTRAERELRKAQNAIVRSARALTNRHFGWIADEYRKAIKVAKKGGQPGDPSFMNEQTKRDHVFDIVQIACMAAGIPVPDGLV